MCHHQRKRYRCFCSVALAFLPFMLSTTHPEPGAADEIESRLACRIAGAAPGGDPQAEGEFYRLMAPRVRRFGLRHLRDRHAADDLMQQVMVLTIEHLRHHRVLETARVVSFVFGACRMTVLQMQRGEQRRQELLHNNADMLGIADIAVAPRLDHVRVTSCLEGLPERERSVLVMSFYAELPAAEVGDSLGLTPGNVRVLRHRGIARLRDCVNGARSVS